jgi:hypothetical protein
MELQNRAPTFMEEATGKRGRGRRLGKRLTDLASTETYDATITEQSRADLADPTYVEEGARQILAAYAPEYEIPKPFEFSVSQESGRLRVSTTVDFAAANAIYHTRIPASHSTLTPAYILSFLSSTRAHLQFASKHGSELALEQVNASLVRLRVTHALEQRLQSQRDLGAFQDFVFDDGCCIREAINSKRRSFPELIEVLKNARKFKTWLDDQDPNEDLLKSYFRESTKDTWIEKLPAKASRWTLFTGLGLAIDAAGAGGLGTAAGLALSAADAFLVDKLIGGWKPSSFVQEQLEPFIST